MFDVIQASKYLKASLFFNITMLVTSFVSIIALPYFTPTLWTFFLVLGVVVIGLYFVSFIVSIIYIFLSKNTLKVRFIPLLGNILTFFLFPMIQFSVIDFLPNSDDRAKAVAEISETVYWYESIVYQNDEYGFAMNLNWKYEDYKTKTELEDENVVVSFYFDTDPNEILWGGNSEYEVFRVLIIPIQSWSQYETQKGTVYTKGQVQQIPALGYLLGTSDEYAFIASTGHDCPREIVSEGKTVDSNYCILYRNVQKEWSTFRLVE